MTLEEALEDALKTLLEPPRTWEGVRAEFPSIGALAQWVAGSEKRSGKPYRTTRRAIERALAKPPKQTRPARALLRRVRDRLRRRRRAVLQRGARVHVKGTFHISHEPARQRERHTFFPAEEITAIVELYEGPGIEAAADRFNEALGEHSLGGGLPIWDRVDVLTIRPGPA